jgi:diaminohydroxyphosphoribosylaminopyrimidine deaminase / 5-amino-6-(5-phosphoribosylamino)uracil reductase
VTGATSAWTIVLAAARNAAHAAAAGRAASFTVSSDATLRPVPATDPGAEIAWDADAGWTTRLPATDPRSALIDLYLPVCSATVARPITVGHLGQSLDGFIATHAGESRWVTGHENMVHMHRMRALCDAVIVGAGTVALDDPRLTTRLVSGTNPLRVVLDPGRRLESTRRVFDDHDGADTLYVCARSLARGRDERFGSATVVGVAETADGGIDLTEVMALLRDRRCARVFVEGGGVTVSMFLEAKLLTRLHVAVAPLLIGDGRPAIRLPPRAALGDCHRPPYRVFKMGGDILFDCDLAAGDAASRDDLESPAITRVI